jgi:hypothetical protein
MFHRSMDPLPRPALSQARRDRDFPLAPLLSNIASCAPPPTQHMPPAPSEEMRDDTYLTMETLVLRQLCELLARSNPEALMPLKR